MNRICLALAFAIAGAGCPSIDNDGPEGTTGPTVEFDPAASVIPFPNNLVRDPATGRVNLPEQCNESPAQTYVRTSTLNKLDGFGTFKVGMQFTLSEPADPATLTAANLKVFRRATGTDAVAPADAEEVPILIVPGSTLRYVDGCEAAPAPIDAVTLVPFVTDPGTGAPLLPVALVENSTYSVMVGDGLRTATGEPFRATLTWEFVRQVDNPVTVVDGAVVAERTPFDPTNPEENARLLGINLLWGAHKGAMDFLTAAAGVTREQILLGWEFTTQTTTKQLDPTVTDSPAGMIEATRLQGMGSALPGGVTPEQYLSAPSRLGAATCGAIGCSSIGAIAGGLVIAPQYQVDMPNPAGFSPIPGQWDDPIHPTKTMDEQIQVVAFLPDEAQIPMPAAGWPTLVFGHGLGSAKETAAAIAPQLARAGFAVIAIDFVAHGSRAKRISDAPNPIPPLSCENDANGAPNPTTKPQCYQAIFSADLGQTRDNFRQTVLDVQQLIASARTCTVAMPCGLLAVDPDKVGYIGISLGGIMGSMVAAESPLLKAAVTNVAGGGWIDIVENTESLSIRCSLVNALIGAGVVMGDIWDPAMPTVGACLTPEWKSQPAYRQFAVIARWVLDPGDPVNFAAKLATRTTLLQEVMGDKVVPNIATDQLGALSGRMPVAAAPAVSVTPPPVSTPPSAVVVGVTTPLWVRYVNLPPDAGVGFPGNSFHHASLLRPNEDGAMAPTAAEQLGWLRMQADAIEYLGTNVIDN
jgi:dienelactone hydrolase